MKIVPLCAFFTMAVVMSLLHAAVADVKPIQIKVCVSRDSPRPAAKCTGGFAPVRFDLEIHTVPVEGDRWIRVMTDTGEFYRRSDFMVTPDWNLYTVGWREIPPGDYLVITEIGHGDQVRASDSARVLVSGS